MKQINREQLSAFLDDELEAAESEMLVRRLGADFDLRGAALRYGLIGDVIRDEVADGDPRDLPRRVADALDREPVLKQAMPIRRLLRPLAGAAVAASVAAIAIVSLPGQQPVVTDPVAVTVPETVVPVTTRVDGPPAAIFRAGSPNQLSRYYLNHSEYATMLGGQGALIRIVRAPDERGGAEEGVEAAAEDDADKIAE